MKDGISEATTRPWRVGMLSGHNANTIYFTGNDANFPDEPVCQVFGIPSNQPVKECADAPGLPVARHIVLCVNSHAALVEALEINLKFMNSLETRVSLEVWQDLYAPLSLTRDTLKALAAAKGEM